MDEQRLIKLEKQTAFQEYLLQELNDVVTNQQQEIDKLKKKINQLTEQNISNTMSDNNLKNEKPPHY
jgi:SlyX protein